MTNTFDYDEAKRDADAIIAEFGAIRAAVIRRESASGSAHDPTITSEDYPATAVVVDYADGVVDGTRIRTGDRRAIIAVGTLTININPTTDQLVLDPDGEAEEILSLVRVKPFNPAGTIVFYEAQVRG